MSHPTTNNLFFGYVVTKIIFAMFKLLGLAPFNIRKTITSPLSKKDIFQDSPMIQLSSSRFGCAYNFFLIPLHIYILIIAIPYSNTQEYPHKTSMTTTIEMAAYVIGYSMLFMIWLSLGFGQTKAVKLLNRLLSLDGAKLGLDGSSMPESAQAFFLVLCITNGIMVTGLVIISYLAYGFLVSCYVTLGVPCIISSWFIAQYIFAVKLITNRLKAINRSLLNCYIPQNFDLRHSLSVPKEFTLTGASKPNIAIIRQAHANVCDIATEISAFYSVPILLAIANACYGLIYSGYYLIVPFLIKTESYRRIMTVCSLVWISCRIVPIAVLAAGVNDVTRETKKSSDVVKKLLTHSNNNRNDTVELRQFLLQLLHRNVKFTACGLFSLDCTLVLSIVGMVITYLIILLQFQLANTTKVLKTGSQE